MSSHSLSPELIEQLVALSRSAGAAIMAIYNNKDSFNVEQKWDDSPLTAADTAAHHIICAGLTALSPLPIISEEAELPAFAERRLWESYWLVDPLDGTKEFIAGNGEFTVNIALVHQGRPLLGVVHVPTSDATYLGVLAAREQSSLGAFKYVGGKNPQPIVVRALADRFAQHLPFTILLSHRYGTQAVIELMGSLRRNWPGAVETTNAGSSLKFCVIAEGRADFYPRLAPTSEWDTAAAQAVLEAAGGAVVRATDDLSPLIYNSSSDILNPHFYALGDRQFDWKKILRP